MNGQSKVGARAAIGVSVVGAGYGVLTHALSPVVLLGVVIVAALLAVVAAVDAGLIRHSKGAPLY